MDEIADSVIRETAHPDELADTPLLLTVVLELTPAQWHALEAASVQEVVQALLVFLNAHLALNNANQVAMIVASPLGARFLYPDMLRRFEDATVAPYVNPGMYRQFRVVDETIVGGVEGELAKMKDISAEKMAKSTLAGAMSLALTYTNRLLHFDQSISTTTASALSTTGSSATASSGSGSSTTEARSVTMDARILVVTPGDSFDSNYIAMMNAIFALQKMKVPIDVAKLGPSEAPYLQQAADTTSGIYLRVSEPKGLVQLLCTAFFVEPSLRNVVILPTNTDVNYKASCFVSGKPIDIGYVCLVCLCIMHEVPATDACPACGLEFDKTLLEQMRRGPTVKRRREDTAPPSKKPAT